MEYKESAKDLAGDKWTLGDVKAIFTEQLWTWDNSDWLAYEGYAYLGFDKCVDFEKYIWFEWESACGGITNFFQYHLKYICNDIVKPLRVGIIRYTDHVQYMQHLTKHLQKI